MFSFKNLALYVLVAIAVFAAYTSATACADDAEAHCSVFAELCENADFATYTAKCPATCGKC